MTQYVRVALKARRRFGAPGPLPDDVPAGLDADALLRLGETMPQYRGIGFLAVEPEAGAPQGRWLHKAKFKQRLTFEERNAIRIAAETDAIVTDFLDLLDSSDEVDLDTANLVAALIYLEARNLLDPGRSAELRADP